MRLTKRCCKHASASRHLLAPPPFSPSHEHSRLVRYEAAPRSLTSAIAGGAGACRHFLLVQRRATSRYHPRSPRSFPGSCRGLAHERVSHGGRTLHVALVAARQFVDR